MKRFIFASAMLAALVLALSLPVGAKPPGGVPPGQAKKGGNGGDVNIGVSVGGVTVQSQGQGKGGPPPWAPAHGYRAKHQYRYWPRSQVYFDAGRGMYFYYSGGSWQAGASLPGGIHISGGYVNLDMDTSKPYKWHKDVVNRYPPVKIK
ncbi:MAG: hypothetical protein KQI62_20540 [Deltaproteobacteria bacterium]|nr:hypothetical protein [Deltaproteobacteria bacterium]